MRILPFYAQAHVHANVRSSERFPNSISLIGSLSANHFAEISVVETISVAAFVCRFLLPVNQLFVSLKVQLPAAAADWLSKLTRSEHAMIQSRRNKVIGLAWTASVSTEKNCLVKSSSRAFCFCGKKRSFLPFRFLYSSASGSKQQQ